MIKLGRRPTKPGLFRSKEFQEFVADLNEFQLAGGTRKKQRIFPWQERFEPFKADAMAALQKVFHGKCAYSEAPLTDESGAVSDAAEFVLHRPASDAIGFDGEISPDHYWWLISEWSNWFLASGSVASVKENRFPVEGERARYTSPLQTSTLAREKSLLLDPCRDDPVWYLQFWRTGVVGACDVNWGKSWPSRRLPSGVPNPGIHTIRTLDLNNANLVSARRRVAGQASKKLRVLLSEATKVDHMMSLVSKDQPFAAATRQAIALNLLGRMDQKRKGPFDQKESSGVRLLLDELQNEIAVAIICPQGKPWRLSESAKELLKPIASSRELSRFPKAKEHFLSALSGKMHRKTSRGVYKVMEDSPAVPVAEDELAPDRPVVDRSAQIKSIHIKNFKAIRKVTIDTSTLKPKEETISLEPAWGIEGETMISNARRWWTFLGENGSGKSSILQAIGLALAGDQIDSVMKEAKLEWDDLLRRPAPGSDEKVLTGRICLDFPGGVRIDLRFNKNKHWWQKDMRSVEEEAADQRPRSGIPVIQTFIRGYGATRLLASGDETKKSNKSTEDNVRIANLLDPLATVLDAEKWLLNDLDEEEFNVAAATIEGMLRDDRDTLPLMPSGTTSTNDKLPRLFDRSTGRVTVGGLPLKLVSDGYRAIIGMLCDIMGGLGKGVSNMHGAPGIVLIDEIGSHLHPRWRMSITRKLRRAMPLVQFIVSTHEPLCLRGLVAKEVVRVYKHNDHGVITEIVDRNPSNYRVDQLLTSEFFGLETTIDPDLERRFHHYYQLLAMDEDDRDDEQEAELSKLRSYLYKHAQPSFGFTRRDQMICEEIDRLISEDYRNHGTSAADADPKKNGTDASLADSKGKRKDEKVEDFVRRRKKRRAEAIKNVRDIWELRSAPYDLEGKK